MPEYCFAPFPPLTKGVGGFLLSESKGQGSKDQGQGEEKNLNIEYRTRNSEL